MMGDALSIRAAAKAIGVNRDTIRAAISADELVAYRLGHRTVRIFRADLERWLSRHRIRPTSHSESVVADRLAHEERTA